MGSIRVFLLENRVATVFCRVRRRRPATAALRRHGKTLLSLFVLNSWAHRLRTKAKSMVSKQLGSRPDYVRVGQDPDFGKSKPVPKGYMAVYVGQKDCDFEKILVPVVYFNHPLFEDLLKASENEYGFDYPGGITIPCRISDFERIQNRIKSDRATRKTMMKRCRFELDCNRMMV